MRQLTPLVLSLAFALCTARTQPLRWIPADGPYGGNIARVVLSPNGALFALNDIGVYRSTDNGENWISVSAASRINSPLSITINPLGHVFVGVNNDGIYRGASWEHVMSAGSNSTGPGSLATHPNTDVIAVSFYKQIAVSDDDGLNWRPVPAKGIDISCGTALAVGPGGEVYADGHDLPSGTYIYKLQAGSEARTREMTVVR